MNPLLSDWNTPYSIAPFDQINDEHFAPAFDTALKNAQVEIIEIAENPQRPSFENTIEALEQSGKALDKVLAVFFSVAGSDSNDTRQALQREFLPKLAAFSSEIYSNIKLFDRITSLWNSRKTLKLSAEQERLLMLTHRRFHRAGAGLTGRQEERMREIMSRLAQLGTAFTQNLLADEANWHMPLANDDLEGLPEFVIAAAHAAGKEKGLDQPVITLSRSLIVPFLQFSSRRDLRELAFRAWELRGANGGDTDNREIAAEILSLREERAKLLGYQSFAEFNWKSKWRSRRKMYATC